jgi:hypothetical protein
MPQNRNKQNPLQQISEFSSIENANHLQDMAFSANIEHHQNDIAEKY